MKIVILRKKADLALMMLISSCRTSHKSARVYYRDKVRYIPCSFCEIGTIAPISHLYLRLAQLQLGILKSLTVILNTDKQNTVDFNSKTLSITKFDDLEDIRLHICIVKELLSTELGTQVIIEAISSFFYC